LQVIRRNLPNPMGIAVHKSDVYWVDRNLASVFKASKLAGNTSLPSSVRTNLPRLRDIAIFDVANQPMDERNPCLRLGNGGCEQLCFSFPLEQANTEKMQYRCACATGELTSTASGGDGRKCDAVTEFLVFSTRTEIRAINLDPHSTNLPFKPVVSIQVFILIFSLFCILKSHYFCKLLNGVINHSPQRNMLYTFENFSMCLMMSLLHDTLYVP
jgi:low density lipoprotein-related protein 2